MYNLLVSNSDKLFLKNSFGNSLTAQGLELCALTVKGTGSIPGQGTKILRSCKPCSTAKKKKKIDKQKYKITAFLRYNSHNIPFKYTIRWVLLYPQTCTTITNI